MVTATLGHLLQQDFAPAWWNQKGWKMRLVEASIDTVMISGPAAWIKVFYDTESTTPWKLTWWMDVFISGETSGWVWLTEEELRAAFGLLDDCFNYSPQASQALKESLDAQVVSAGKFVRTGRFLTVPNVAVPLFVGMPDFNVSVCLDETIRQAVEELLRHHS